MLKDIINIKKFELYYKFDYEEFFNENKTLISQLYDLEEINFEDNKNFLNLFYKKIDNNINLYNKEKKKKIYL